MSRWLLLTLLFQLYFSSGNASPGACQGFYLNDRVVSAYSFSTFKSSIQLASNIQLPKSIHYTFSFELPGLVSEFERAFSTAFPMKVELSTGEHPLSAKAAPVSGTLFFDRSLWSQAAPYRLGIVGHEAGHVIFQKAMRERISRQFGPDKDWLRLASKYTDISFLNTTIRNLEYGQPSLKRMSDESFYLGSVSREDYSMYKMLKHIREKLIEKDESTSAQEGLNMFILNQMAGFHEVFGDFVGAIFAKDASWSKKTFPDVASRVLRDFKMPFDVIQNPLVWNEIKKTVGNGVPHLYLYTMRAQIYEEFYHLEKKEIGDSWSYDSRVAKMVIEAMGDAYIDVIMSGDDPSPKADGGASLNLFMERSAASLVRKLKEVKNRNINYFLDHRSEDFGAILERIAATRKAEAEAAEAAKIADKTREKVIVPADAGRSNFRNRGY